MPHMRENLAIGLDREKLIKVARNKICAGNKKGRVVLLAAVEFFCPEIKSFTLTREFYFDFSLQGFEHHFVMLRVSRFVKKPSRCFYGSALSRQHRQDAHMMKA